MFGNSNTPSGQNYDYTQSGIDNFLGRAIDQVSWQTTLDAMLNFPGSETLSTLPGQMNSNNVAYDRNQITGGLGNTLQAGSMTVDPNTDAMTLNQGTIQING